MAFVRKKKVKGIDYYYLVENKREGKKVKQKILAYYGRKRPPKGGEMIMDENVTCKSLTAWTRDAICGEAWALWSDTISEMKLDQLRAVQDIIMRCKNFPIHADGGESAKPAVAHKRPGAKKGGKIGKGKRKK